MDELFVRPPRGRPWTRASIWALVFGAAIPDPASAAAPEGVAPGAKAPTLERDDPVLDLPELAFVTLRGWSKDGRWVVWTGVVQSDGDTSAPTFRYELVVVADATGRPRRLFRGKAILPAGDGDEEASAHVPEGVKLWARAEPEDAGTDWLRAHPLVPAPASRKLTAAKPARSKSPHGGLTARLRVFPAPPCRDAALDVTLAGRKGELFSMSCFITNVHGAKAESTIQIAWSPDGKRAAVAWVTHGWASLPGAAVDIRRARVAVVPDALTRLLVLDAGAGEAGVDALRERLEAAGFRVDPGRGATGGRPGTTVFYAPGLEEGARLVADTLAVDPSEVKPMSDGAPVILVAVGGAPPAGSSPAVPASAPDTTALSPTCRAYVTCLIAVGRELRRADFPGARDSASALEGSAFTTAGTFGRHVADEEPFCRTSLESIRTSMGALTGFSLPPECR